MSLEESRQKYYIVSWDQFHQDTRVLAEKLMELGKDFKGILAITRGGLFPAGIIARELDVRNIKTVCISSYEGDMEMEQGKKLNVLYAPECDGDGEGYLIIDDLVDTGETAKFIKAKYPKAYFATVYAKPKGKEFAESYVKEVGQNIWIVFPWDMELTPNYPLISHKSK